MLQQASVTGLIKTVLIILLFYYGFKIVFRFLIPYLLKYAVKKAGQSFGSQFGEFYQHTQTGKTKKEGEVTIDKMPSTKKSNKDIGEYVDFEEIS